MSQQEVMTKLLTYYRAVPAMYRALTGVGPTKERAEKDLVIALRRMGVLIKQDEIQEYIKPFKSWIIYTMNDFFHYTTKCLSEVDEKCYWPRMNEEAALVTNFEPFMTKIHWPTILDIGAGCAPFMQKFKDANTHPLNYLAIDKRYTSNTRIKNIPGVLLKTFTGEVRNLSLSLQRLKPDVLFLANFLHCLKDIEELFDFILPLLPTLKLIKILEVKPNCTLDFLFDYHMFEHSNGQRIDFFHLDALFPGKCKSVASLGEYHEMYTVEL